ncbi:MAG: polysaccharide biosynthesis/export family protein [Chitinophagaceae bacterium]|nr:polysaccharide biosynthesis/export family protein [Chitinophagaceae bacterium]
MKKLLFFAMLTLIFSACQTGKQLAFFQDLNSEAGKKQDVRIAAYDPLRLQADDQVQVVVSSISPEAATMFNLMGTSVMNGAGSAPQMMQSVYTVSPSGNITIPGIGDIKVAGLTTDEAKIAVKNVVVEYLKDAVISVTLVNFRITVMGEVARPATYPVAGEKINVLQALGMAGDLTIYAKRGSIKVYRKAEDKIEVGTLDINHSSVMRSPFYNLRQNDVIVVEPFKRKGLQAENLSLFIPAATSILSLIIVALTRIR